MNKRASGGAEESPMTLGGLIIVVIMIVSSTHIMANFAFGKTVPQDIRNNYDRIRVELTSKTQYSRLVLTDPKGVYMVFDQDWNKIITTKDNKSITIAKPPKCGWLETCIVYCEELTQSVEDNSKYWCEPSGVMLVKTDKAIVGATQKGGQLLFHEKWGIKSGIIFSKKQNQILINTNLAKLPEGNEVIKKVVQNELLTIFRRPTKDQVIIDASLVREGLKGIFDYENVHEVRLATMEMGSSSNQLCVGVITKQGDKSVYCESFGPKDMSNLHQGILRFANKEKTAAMPCGEKDDKDIVEHLQVVVRFFRDQTPNYRFYLSKDRSFACVDGWRIGDQSYLKYCDGFDDSLDKKTDEQKKLAIIDPPQIC